MRSSREKRNEQSNKPVVIPPRIKALLEKGPFFSSGNNHGQRPTSQNDYSLQNMGGSRAKSMQEQEFQRRLSQQAEGFSSYHKEDSGNSHISLPPRLRSHQQGVPGPYRNPASFRDENGPSRPQRMPPDQFHYYSEDRNGGWQEGIPSKSKGNEAPMIDRRHTLQLDSRRSHPQNLLLQPTLPHSQVQRPRHKGRSHTFHDFPTEDLMRKDSREQYFEESGNAVGDGGPFPVDYEDFGEKEEQIWGLENGETSGRYEEEYLGQRQGEWSTQHRSFEEEKRGRFHGEEGRESFYQRENERESQEYYERPKALISQLSDPFLRKQNLSEDLPPKRPIMGRSSTFTEGKTQQNIARNHQLNLSRNERHWPTNDQRTSFKNEREFARVDQSNSVRTNSTAARNSVPETSAKVRHYPIMTPYNDERESYERSQLPPKYTRSHTSIVPSRNFERREENEEPGNEDAVTVGYLRSRSLTEGKKGISRVDIGVNVEKVQGGKSRGSSTKRGESVGEVRVLGREDFDEEEMEGVDEDFEYWLEFARKGGQKISVSVAKEAEEVEDFDLYPIVTAKPIFQATENGKVSLSVNDKPKNGMKCRDPSVEKQRNGVGKSGDLNGKKKNLSEYVYVTLDDDIPKVERGKREGLEEKFGTIGRKGNLSLSRKEGKLHQKEEQEPQSSTAQASTSGAKKPLKSALKSCMKTNSGQAGVELSHGDERKPPKSPLSEEDKKYSGRSVSPLNLTRDHSRNLETENKNSSSGEGSTSAFHPVSSFDYWL